MDTLLQNILKPEAYNRYTYIKPLLNINIKLDSVNINRLYNIVKNNYPNSTFIFDKVNPKLFDIIKNVIKKWQNIKIIHQELNLVKNIYMFQTKNLKLYLLEPHNVNCDSLFQKIINIAITLEKFSSNTGIVYIFPINYNRDLFDKQFNNISYDLKNLENNYKALTIAGQVFQSNSTVFVMRNEECLKLFIHEILHLFQLDVPHNDSLENELDFNCELVGRTFESYTELYSNLLNTFFFCIRNNLDIYLIDLVKIEIIYSIYCSAKLLYLYCYDSSNYKDFFFKKDNKKLIKNNIPSIYYYIIKSIHFVCHFIWLKLINNKLLIDYNFLNLEKHLVSHCIRYKKYHLLLFESLKLIEKNNDKSLSYIVLDQ